jgi:MATE family multidrug resistance protein
VGNLIGAKNGRGARKAAHAAAFLSAILGGIVMTVMLIAKDVNLVIKHARIPYLLIIIQVYGYAFSDEVDVVGLVAQVMPLVASFQVADGLAGSCGGVLRGQGKLDQQNSTRSGI